MNAIQQTEFGGNVNVIAFIEQCTYPEMSYMYLGRAMRKSVCEHMRIAKAQITCASAQSDLGLNCPLTELLDTT